MNEATRQMVLNWVKSNNGNVEAVVLFMSRKLRIGGMKACRALVAQALA